MTLFKTRTLSILGMLILSAACSSESGRSPISPSTAAPTPGSTAAGPGTPVLKYDVTLNAPLAPLPSGSTNNSFSITITNDAATTSNHTLKSATIDVSAFSNVSNLAVTNGWSKSLVTGHIQVAKVGNTALDPGQSVTVTFTADAPTLANCTSHTYTLTTLAFESTDFVSTPFDLVGSQPSVTVVAPCPTACTQGFGYWKEHQDSWPASVLSGGLALGGTTYTAAQLKNIMDQPVSGNGLVSLAHHLITAKINIANGADGSVIASTISAADTMIGGLIVPPVGSGSLTTAQVDALKTALENFDEGVTGPGKCQ